MTAVYAAARHQGVTEEMIKALPDFRESHLFTPGEKAAIAFAETLATDHKQVSQALFDELNQHFSEPEIMALGWRMAIFIGYGRLVYATGLDSVGKPCPLSFAHEALQTEAAAQK
jgi:alkylhydroperoxidase family enzyme